MLSLGGDTRVSCTQFGFEERLVLTCWVEESLLVIRGLGIQTSTTSSTYLSTSTTRFIPTNLIQDIFIHEAFKGFEVKFYLAVVVEGEEEVVVVFPVGAPIRSSPHFCRTIQTQSSADHCRATV